MIHDDVYIRKAVAGDDKAFDALAKRHCSKIYKVFLLILFMALLSLNLYAHTSGESHQHPHTEEMMKQIAQARRDQEQDVKISNNKANIKRLEDQYNARIDFIFTLVIVLALVVTLMIILMIWRKLS